MTEPFRVVVADPPWAFSDKLPGRSRGAEKNYKVMTFGEIINYPLPPIAENAWLFLWRVSAMQGCGLATVAAWGFEHKTEIVWRKLTKTGRKLHFGMGRSVRMCHETCIIATRGKVKPAVRNIRSVFDAPVGRHSEKPDMFYKIVEELTGEGPRCELFARKRRENWTTIGDEIA